MSEIPERVISGQLAPARGKKFAEFLADHTSVGPGTVDKYVRVIRALLKEANIFSIEAASRFSKKKNRTYVRAAIVKYIEFMDSLGELEEWGPGSAEGLIKKLPRVHEPPPKPRKLPEAEELLQAIAELEKEYRFAALFMFYTGARSEEAMGVKLKDVDFDTGDVTIYGKGKVQKAPREVKLPASFLGDLRTYHRSLGTLSGEYLFVTDSKASLESRTRLFRRAFGAACKKILGRTIGAHDFRRFAGTTVYMNTRDPKAARDFLGHAKIDTTMRYIDYADRSSTLEKARDIMAHVEAKYPSLQASKGPKK